MPTDNEKTASEPRQRRWLRPAIDYGPVLAFFITYFVADLFVATWVIIGTTVAGIALALWLERRVPLLPLITAIVVGVFGGLTILLNEEIFIKMKPTIIQALMGSVLLGGLAFKKPLLRPLLERSLQLPAAGWRILTLRFGLFMLGMAGLNELVWRTQSTDFWVSFKLFGIIGLTFVFMVLQVPFIKRHAIQPPEGGQR